MWTDKHSKKNVTIGDKMTSILQEIYMCETENCVLHIKIISTSENT